MNVRAMIDGVNFMLAKMELQFTEAQKSFGVRPDLAVAEQRINDAGATLMELRNQLVELQNLGFQHPPDVIERFNTKYFALHKMAAELNECKLIVHVRSHSGRPQKTLN